jgi:chlorobactene glucosyltransferase
LGDRYSLALLLGQVAGLALAERDYRRLPALCPTGPGRVPSAVSIVVPARNEEAQLPALLASLQSLVGVESEIIVVDDNSTDGTASVALEAGCTVIHAGPLRSGWTGKSHACAAGAAAARHDWLLFTDADTQHAPESLRAAVTAAEALGADLLSLMPRQECRTFWERLLLPYAYALYFAGVWWPNAPGGQAVANGQYMLFRRDAYMRSGGHTAVRASVIEDVALAGTLSRAGLRVVLVRGEWAVSVRMYGGLMSIWEGFSKNAFRFLLNAPISGAGTALLGIALLSAAPAARRGGAGWLRSSLLLLPAAGLVPWYRRFGVNPLHTLLFPLAAVVFQAIALDSMRRTALRGATRWKGRSY